MTAIAVRVLSPKIVSTPHVVISLISFWSN